MEYWKKKQQDSSRYKRMIDTIAALALVQADGAETPTL